MGFLAPEDQNKFNLRIMERGFKFTKRKYS
jgi:hypothetical protein